MNIALNRNTDNRGFSVYNIIESIRSTGNLRKTSWIFSRAVKGYFYNVEADDAINYADTIDSMISVLNRVYGENWDFHLRPRMVDNHYKFELHVLIHYPLTVIDNRDEQSHEIKDLIVTFEIKNQGVNDEGRTVYSPGLLHGTKGTFSYEEWFVGYVHSHLGTRKPESFNRCFDLGEFCIGTGELYDLQATLRADYIEGLFELYLITLQTLVKWESIEGGPYIFIRDINIGKDSRESDLGVNYMSSYYPTFRGEITNLDLDFVFSENMYKIMHNSKFETLVKDVVVNKLNNGLELLIVTRVGERFFGYAFPKIETKEQLRNRFYSSRKGLPYTLIQGKKIEFKVEEFTGEMPDISNYGVHPKFLNYVSTKLEQELYKKTIRRSVIERHNQSINA